MMKKTALILLLLIGIFPLCANAQYQVNYISTDGESMTFRVVGYGKNSRKASDDAEIKTIKALMFHGIPNTQYSVPMVAQTESAAMKEHGQFLNDFFGGEYKNLIARSVIVRKFEKDANKQKSITLEVTVNVRALRVELERNGVIRKFGL